MLKVLSERSQDGMLTVKELCLISGDAKDLKRDWSKNSEGLGSIGTDMDH